MKDRKIIFKNHYKFFQRDVLSRSYGPRKKKNKRRPLKNVYAKKMKKKARYEVTFEIKTYRN